MCREVRRERKITHRAERKGKERKKKKKNQRRESAKKYFYVISPDLHSVSFLLLPSLLGRIKHFGGPVTYCADDFCSRNHTSLDRDLSRAMFHCEHPLMKVFFPEGTNSAH